MRIAIFDYQVRRHNPIGRCHLRMMEALCEEHDFVVFAPEFDNPRPDRIAHVRVPTPLRPLALQYVVYLVLAPLAGLLRRWRTGERFDRVLCVESNILRADVVHAHFCHRAFIRARREWSGHGLTVLFRRLDHIIRSATEPLVYRSARQVVVPSHGLRRELEDQFPALRGRVTVIPNPIDAAGLRMPDDFDRDTERAALGFGPDDLVLAFAALGHFERKGLPLAMKAMAALDSPLPLRKREKTASLKLVVVGGRPEAVAAARQQAASLGIADRVVFAGMRPDVRPFLWASDAFVFPSQYETFSLVCYEAAAAGRPVLVTRLHGVEEFARDGVTALVVERTQDAVTGALRRLAAMTPEERRAMGARAADAVAACSPEAFIHNWRAFWAATAPRTIPITEQREAVP